MCGWFREPIAVFGRVPIASIHQATVWALIARLTRDRPARMLMCHQGRLRMTRNLHARDDVSKGDYWIGRATYVSKATESFAPVGRPGHRSQVSGTERMGGFDDNTVNTTRG